MFWDTQSLRLEGLSTPELHIILHNTSIEAMAWVAGRFKPIELSFGDSVSQLRLHVASCSDTPVLCDSRPAVSSFGLVPLAESDAYIFSSIQLPLQLLGEEGHAQEKRPTLSKHPGDLPEMVHPVYSAVLSSWPILLCYATAFLGTSGASKPFLQKASQLAFVLSLNTRHHIELSFTFH